MSVAEESTPERECLMRCRCCGAHLCEDRPDRPPERDEPALSDNRSEEP